MESIKEIDWKQFGVITEGTETVKELIIVFVVFTVGFTILYYANKAIFPIIMDCLSGPDGHF